MKADIQKANLSVEKTLSVDWALALLALKNPSGKFINEKIYLLPSDTLAIAVEVNRQSDERAIDIGVALLDPIMGYRITGISKKIAALPELDIDMKTIGIPSNTTGFSDFRIGIRQNDFFISDAVMRLSCW